MELKRENIIKALECCISRNLADYHHCPYAPENECHRLVLTNALSLINELTEENERLRAQNETLEIIEKDLRFRNNELQKANEGLAKNCEELEIEGDELRERIANLKKSYADYEETTGLKQARADTVRKMQTALWANLSPYSNYTTAEVGSLIDQIAKEMLEGTK